MRQSVVQAEISTQYVVDFLHDETSENPRCVVDASRRLGVPSIDAEKLLVEKRRIDIRRRRREVGQPFGCVAYRRQNRSGRDARTEAAVRGVLALHEKYPELRADTLYRDLHERLWALEEKLAHTRQLYNDIATEWNDRITKFPQGLVAKLMRCRQAPLFAGDDADLPPRLVE